MVNYALAFSCMLVLRLVDVRRYRKIVFTIGYVVCGIILEFVNFIIIVLLNVKYNNTAILHHT